MEIPVFVRVNNVVEIVSQFAIRPHFHQVQRILARNPDVPPGVFKGFKGMILVEAVRIVVFGPEMDGTIAGIIYRKETGGPRHGGIGPDSSFGVAKQTIRRITDQYHRVFGGVLKLGT